MNNLWSNVIHCKINIKEVNFNIKGNYVKLHVCNEFGKLELLIISRNTTRCLNNYLNDIIIIAMFV